jgi:CPA2 family monovalent cation:H+ antiporter-2
MHEAAFIQDLAIILAAAAGLGWLCQRIGLSAVVGYLVAGMVVGPYTPPFSLVTDDASIATAAEVGLVFLMFSIGLRLSFRRLKRLGLGLVLAVFIGAVLVYYATRGLGLVAGLDGGQTLFLASMLMVSSSAIISKVLHETGAGHERHGQLAMGVAVLEDVVAVVMLTVLNSVVALGDGNSGGGGLAATLGGFGAFVVFTGVLGLLLVPWLLRVLSVKADEELQTLATAALLFGLAIIAQRAGYSLALGAFLIGCIVAETPHRHSVERIFEGMRDVFSAVFFVAIGLQIDVRALGEAWWLVLGLALFTLIVRVGAVSTGLVLIGRSHRDALRAGLVATPIGEFSFIIAQLGVAAKLVPTVFYPLAVGLSLVTSLTAPFLTRKAEPVADVLLRLRPRWLVGLLESYQGWLDRLGEKQAGNMLWKLCRRRVIQIVVELLFVAGLLASAERLQLLITRWLNGPGWLFWTALVAVAMVPLFAVWRNVSVLALMVAEFSTEGMAVDARDRLRNLIALGVRIVATVAMVTWVASFAPTGAVRWALPASALVALAVFVWLRQRMIFWHSELEVGLQDVLGDAGVVRMSSTSVPWAGRQHEEWNLSVADCVIPDLAECSGRSLAQLGLRARFGCTVVGVERQGCMISLPGSGESLFPRDKVLLLGDPEHMVAAKAALGVVAATESSEFDAVGLETILVPARSRAAGATLAELSPSAVHGVQLAGIGRGPLRILNPGPGERLQPGDKVLALGTPVKLRAFRAWVRDNQAQRISAGGGDGGSRTDGEVDALA